ncbi:MAG: HAD family hydrolase [Candidatus Omnitrophica bacterium]|nr:HAD family hydrolase [Candidatus Omnitrophota bacterium]
MNFKRKKEFLVAVDSDGSVFPTMDIKQKECIHPAIMDQWGLWKIEKEVRMVAEWVNLYSVYRGTNRFLALKMVFDYLRNMPEVREKNVVIRLAEDLGDFLGSGLPASNEALAEYAAQHPELNDVLDWSRSVNKRIAERCRMIPPFPFVRESLEKLQSVADLVVVSATPAETLIAEWRESGLDQMVRSIAGQEFGSKKEQLQAFCIGEYPPDQALMIGDAPGDLKAVKEFQGLFFPINPKREFLSWKRLLDESGNRFLSGTYAGAYESSLIREFEVILTEKLNSLIP